MNDAAFKKRTIRQLTRAGKVILVACLVLVCFTGCSLAPGIETEDVEQSSVQDFMEEGSYEEAAQLLASEIEEGEDTQENYRLLGICYMGMGEYENAEEAFLSALGKAGIIPGEMEYDINYYLGSCYYKLEQYEESLQVYDAILALKPKDSDALEMRGVVRMQLGDTEGMMDDFNKAIELDSSNYDRMIEIYEVLSFGGYEEEGQLVLTQALEANTGDMSYYDLGRISYYAGDYDTARTALEQLQDNSDYRVVLMLGKTYEALGDFNYATNVYETYLMQDSSQAEVYNQLGLCYMSMENYEEALSAFENGLETGDESMAQSLMFNEIVAYEYLGDFETAADCMEEYIEKYPGDETAAREYIFLSTR